MRSGLRTELLRIRQRVAKRQAEPVLVYMSPTYFARRRLGFDPDPWQEEVLQSQSKRLLLNCCRQSGKSTTTAALALHEAMYKPKALVLLVSPSLRQSSELFKKVQDFLMALPVRPALIEDNKLSLQLRNGSRIVSLPSKEDTIRGFSGASLIIEDEAARVTDGLFYALRPMLAVSNGRHILMSTPWGRRGHFFEAWETGGADWQRIRIPATECPRIPAAFLTEEQRTMPWVWFDSEYNCLFTEVDGAVFRYDDLLVALSADITPLQLGGMA
jgi:hypothetical protein